MYLVPAGITPDRFTFNALLEAHAAAGSLEGASKIYDAMAQRRIPPDICTFIALFQVLPSHLMAAHVCLRRTTTSVGRTCQDVPRCSHVSYSAKCSIQDRTWHMERVQLSRFCEIVQDFQHGRRGG